uniref:Uncharacterized protein n=1 Tax=Setaria italica TaxID=4555 RepID=K3ZZJ2_SETIT
MVPSLIDYKMLLHAVSRLFPSFIIGQIKVFRMFLRVIFHEVLRVHQRPCSLVSLEWHMRRRRRQKSLMPSLVLRRRWWRIVCLGGWRMVRRICLRWWTGMYRSLRHRRCSRRWSRRSKWKLRRLLSRTRFEVIRYCYNLRWRWRWRWRRRWRRRWLWCRLVLFLGVL